MQWPLGISKKLNLKVIDSLIEIERLCRIETLKE